MSTFDDHLIKKKKDTKCSFLQENPNNHFIVYDTNHLNNYRYTLSQLKIQSESELKYCRKTVITHNEKEYSFITSDIHIEVDFEQLGVNENGIYFELFKHVSENMILTKSIFYIVCLHYNEIKQELLQVFHSFLDIPKMYIIMLTDEISFIPTTILSHSVIKKSKSTTHSKYNTEYEKRALTLVNWIINDNNVSLFIWREKLYELLIFNDNIHKSFSFIIQKLIEENYIQEENMNMVFEKYKEIIRKFNNNYRTIYHLELFIVYLRNLKN